MRPVPFNVVRKDGIVWVDKAVDAEFRKALLQGIPPVLRPKMWEALAAYPDQGALAHSKRYFGDELWTIRERIKPLVIALNDVLTRSFNLPGLFDWLEVTNYGNDYRMIKALAAWAEMASSRPPSEPVPLKEQPAAPLANSRTYVANGGH